MPRFTTSAFCRAFLIFAGCLSSAGCGQAPPDLPRTFPVTGEVRYRDGRLLESGLLQLQPEDGSSLNVSGTVTRGSFTIRTSFKNGVAQGATPGRYRVTVTPAFEATPTTIQLAETFEVGAAPTQFKITLPVSSP